MSAGEPERWWTTLRLTVSCDFIDALDIAFVPRSGCFTVLHQQDIHTQKKHFMVEFVFRNLKLRVQQISGNNIQIFISKGGGVKVFRYLFMS